MKPRTLGRRLKRLRKINGETQREFVENFGRHYRDVEKHKELERKNELKELAKKIITTDILESKHYQVVGFEETGLAFCFAVTAENFSEALRKIEKDYYMTDMTFYKLEIREINE